MPGVLDVAVSFPILLPYGKRAYCVDLVWGCQDKNIRFALKRLKKTVSHPDHIALQGQCMLYLQRHSISAHFFSGECAWIN
jgi:hypothetical protein